MKTRPYRIYKRRGEQKKYIRKDGKKTYIRTQKKMTNKNLVTVMIKNIVGHKRVPNTNFNHNRTEKKPTPLAYTQPIAPRLVHVPFTPFLTDDKKEIEKLKKKVEKQKISVVINPEEKEPTKKPHEPKVHSVGTELERTTEDPKNYTLTALTKGGDENEMRRREVGNLLGTHDPEHLRELLLHENGKDTLTKMTTIRNHREVDYTGPDLQGNVYSLNEYDNVLLEANGHNFKPKNPEDRRNHPPNHPIDKKDPNSNLRLNVEDGKGNGDGDGLNTDEIEKFLNARTHTIIPCIAHDEMDTLLPQVHKGMKEFGFVFNTDNHNQSGQHWRACYINTETGECDYFDSLVSEPDKTFMKGITKIIDKLDPPIYLKLKINRVKLQNNTSANCGQFCCQFLDKMYHGGSFKQATQYDTINGEKSVDKYKSKWGLI